MPRRRRQERARRRGPRPARVCLPQPGPGDACREPGHQAALSWAARRKRAQVTPASVNRARRGARHGPQDGRRRGGGLRGLRRGNWRVSRARPGRGRGRSLSRAAAPTPHGTFLDLAAEPEPLRLNGAAGTAPPAGSPSESRRDCGGPASSQAGPEGRVARSMAARGR